MPSFQAAMVLMGIFMLGLDVPAIARLTTCSEAFIERVIRRCRKAKILRANTIRVDWEHDHGMLCLMLDALVATGYITRGCDPKETAKRKDVRQARKETGRCSNCGRARDDEAGTCSQCRISMAQSVARRKGQPEISKQLRVKPGPVGKRWYLHNNYATTRQTTRLGAPEEELGDE